jgi:hypothetical protein
MSAGYTSNGKRLSAMTHAKHGHDCDICGKRVFGNGGETSHGRAHVRRGEAVELLKEYATYPPTSMRVFLPSEDQRVDEFLGRGFGRVSS